LDPKEIKFIPSSSFFRDVSDALVKTRDVSQVPAVSPAPEPVAEVSIYYVDIFRISQGYAETLQRLRVFHWWWQRGKVKICDVNKVIVNIQLVRIDHMLE
jgi:hypothetical protein